LVCDTGYAGVGAVLINFPHFSVLDYKSLIGRIVETTRFLSFDVRLDVGRRHQPHGVAKYLQLA
jgi:hypothetical protein